MQDDDDIDGGLIGESPYIGRARYKANHHSQEHSLLSTPQKIQIHSIGSLSPATPAQTPQHLAQLQHALDAEIAQKQRHVQTGEI